MIWNIRKKKASNQYRKKKKESKNQGQYKEPLGLLQALQHSYDRGAEGEEREQESRNLFEKIIKENFPNLVKEIDIRV